MNVPAGLFAAALLFWGQQAELLFLAAPLAAALEGFRFSRRRWHLNRADFSRISDLSALLFAGMAIYLYITEPANRAFMTLSSWLPLAFVPLLAAQLYSEHGEVDVRALFVFMRGQPEEPRWTVDIGYPFLVLCLLAASVANRRTPVFYAGTVLFTAWALWRARPKAGSLAVWSGILAAAACLGYAGHVGLHALQSYLENKAADFVFGGDRVRLDARQAVTAMGHIGALKRSDRIVLRVEPGGAAGPILLRGAGYNFYSAGSWHAWDAAFEAVATEADGVWDLAPDPSDSPRANVSLFLEGGTGLLALPGAAARLTGLAAGTLSRNRLGAVKIEEGPGLASYTVESSRRAGRDGPPERRDLQIPSEEVAVLSRIAKALKLRAQDPVRAIETLKRYFSDDFRYSIYRADAGPAAAALDEFLLKTHAGHCEHFATAAVLLLRAAGIPARYAVGYSAQEYSKLEGAYIVRDRHAHAWALAHVEEAWVDVDATPPSWPAVEAAQAPRWTAARDLCSWWAYRFARWRWAPRDKNSRNPLRWALFSVLAFFGVKWLREFLSVQRRRSDGQPAPASARQGLDSDWYAVEAALDAAGLGRQPWETAGLWLKRLEALRDSSINADLLRALAALHYRHRFDPRGLSATQRQSMRRQAEAFLQARPR